MPNPSELAREEQSAPMTEEARKLLAEVERLREENRELRECIVRLHNGEEPLRPGIREEPND